MQIIPVKHDYENIAKGSALLTFAALASSTGLVWLTNGVVGKITMILLTNFYTYLASKGVIMLNLGVNLAEVLADKNTFDGTLDDALKAVHAQSDKLTPEQKAAIDAKVIVALRDFASYRMRNDQGAKP
jgi:hypothetical protein